MGLSPKTIISAGQVVRSRSWMDSSLNISAANNELCSRRGYKTVYINQLGCSGLSCKLCRIRMHRAALNQSASFSRRHQTTLNWLHFGII